jgi:hypothetical protein
VNYVENKKSLINYFNYVFNSFYTVNINSKYSYWTTGRIGSYLGYGYDMYINPRFVNLEIFKTGIDISYQDKYLWDDGLRAVVATFTFLQKQSTMYFFVSITYECTAEGSVLPPNVFVDNFMLDIYGGTRGAKMHIMDIIRLIITILLFAFIIKDIIDDKRKLSLNGENYSIFRIILATKVILECCSIFTYWGSLAIKLNYLNDKIGNTLYRAEDISTHQWVTIPRFEFFWTQYWYFTDNCIESAIFILVSWRFCMFFYTFSRIRSFGFFLVSAFMKISSFLLILIIVIFTFAVFSNNLFGNEFDNFRDFSTSLVNILMFSIGHFNISVLKFNQTMWLIILMILILIILIFFFLSTFVGIYLESFRITSMRKGYSFDKKNKDSERFMKFILNKSNISKKKVVNKSGNNKEN